MSLQALLWTQKSTSYPTSLITASTATSQSWTGHSSVICMVRLGVSCQQHSIAVQMPMAEDAAFDFALPFFALPFPVGRPIALVRQKQVCLAGSDMETAAIGSILQQVAQHGPVHAILLVAGELLRH